MGQETSKYDNQKYTGATRLDDGETYDTYRDKNKVERYDDSKNKRTLLPTFSAKKIQPPAVLAKDRAEENRPKSMGNFAKGGKVGKVMGEFKSGALKSSSGQKVTNRKQAMAIAMSEAGKSKMKKFAAGGKTDKRSFASGDVFSNYDVGKDPFLNSRKGGTFTDKEMKDGLTKEEIMRKTTPKETPKKYAAGGNVKKFAAGGMSAAAPRNSIDQMKQAANLVKTVKNEAAKRGMVSARPMGGYGTAGLGRAAMGALRGMGGGTGTTSPLGNVGNAVAGVGKGMFGMKRGGKVGESKEMVEKEMAFMKKKGAPKSMMKHEKEEAKGMKKMAKGGMSCMKRGGGVEVKGYKKGGMIDGCAVRGKTKLPRGGK